MAELQRQHVGGTSEMSSGGLFGVTIVTPYGSRAEYFVRHLRAPGVEGEFGVLVGHVPFITALKTGVLELDQAGTKRLWAISGGFAEVLPDRVIILAETAEPAESIDLARADAARQRALRRLQETHVDDNFDVGRAKDSLARAINRIRIASGNLGDR